MKKKSSLTDKYGNFVVDSVMLGEYAFAEIDSSLGLQPAPLKEQTLLQVFPNPARTQINLTWEQEDMRFVELFDLSGRSIGRMPLAQGARSCVYPVEHLAAGLYVVKMVSKKGELIQSKVMIEK